MHFAVYYGPDPQRVKTFAVKGSFSWAFDSIYGPKDRIAITHLDADTDISENTSIFMYLLDTSHKCMVKSIPVACMELEYIFPVKIYDVSQIVCYDVLLETWQIGISDVLIEMGKDSHG